MKVLMVLSGGMDSAVALALSKMIYDVVGTVSFWYGSKHNDQEWKAVTRICAHYGVEPKQIRLNVIAENFKSDLLKSGGEIPEGHYEDPSMKRTVVPFRNGIMLSIAAGLAESMGAECICIGNHSGDHAIYPDCRQEFIDSMQNAIKAGTYAKIEILSPFCGITKTQIVKLGTALQVPFDLTYSCYKGGDLHCGRCGTCYERSEAFKNAGIPDPTRYLALAK